MCGRNRVREEIPKKKNVTCKRAVKASSQGIVDNNPMTCMLFQNKISASMTVYHGTRLGTLYVCSKCWYWQVS